MYLYQKIFEDLKNKIIKSVYPPGSLLPSEREIGEVYQVDRTTVRKAFQLLVEQSLVEKRAGKGTVVIHRSSITSNNTGTASQSGTIAFFLPKSNRNCDRITVPFYSQLFYSVEKECSKMGLSLVYSTLDDADNLSDILCKHNSNFIGIMFVSNISVKHIDQALSLNLPTILINGKSEKIASITSDNFNGTYKSFYHLVDLGHKDICILNGIKDYYSASERMRGVQIAAEECGIPLQPDYMISDNSWEFEDGFNAAKRMLETVDHLPTAILAFNDRLAAGALHAILQANLRVPEDISIIGFDNSDQSKYSMPPLSTVEINVPHIAKIATAYLHYQIQQQTNIPCYISVPVSYIERESVCKLDPNINTK